jgi:lysozyme family protein
VAWQLFDFAVNSGISTAIRAYQRALGVADDGHFGDASYKASQSMTECDQIMRVVAERLEFMTRTSGWPTFGKGWARRIAANLRYGALDS